MQIELADRTDLAAIKAVYADARALQQERGAPGWPEFSDDFVIAELDAGRVYRVMNGGELAGVFSVAHDDAAIWGEHERGQHIYLHRIARSASYSGRGLLNAVLDWSRRQCQTLGRAGLRIDTWTSNSTLINFYITHGFRVIGARRIGADPRLPPHYVGLEVTLLEATCHPLCDTTI